MHDRVLPLKALRQLDALARLQIALAVAAQRALRAADARDAAHVELRELGHHRLERLVQLLAQVHHQVRAAGARADAVDVLVAAQIAVEIDLHQAAQALEDQVLHKAGVGIGERAGGVVPPGDAEHRDRGGGVDADPEALRGGGQLVPVAVLLVEQVDDPVFDHAAAVGAFAHADGALGQHVQREGEHGQHALVARGVAGDQRRADAAALEAHRQRDALEVRRLPAVEPAPLPALHGLRRSRDGRARVRAVAPAQDLAVVAGDIQRQVRHAGDLVVDEAGDLIVDGHGRNPLPNPIVFYHNLSDNGTGKFVYSVQN